MALILAAPADADTPSASGQAFYFVNADLGGSVVGDSDQKTSNGSSDIRLTSAPLPGAATPTATVAAIFGGMPSVGATVSASVGETRSSGNASLGYTVIVNGPTDGLDIPVFYAGALSTSAFGGSAYAAYANARLDIYVNPDPNRFDNTPAASWLSAACNACTDRATTDSVDASGSIVARSGDIFSVFLGTRAEASGAYGTSEARGYADPYFYIAPEFLASHSGYSLSFSPNIGNDAPISPVPEPAAWAIMIAGFALVAGAMRRRRRLLPIIA